MDGGGRSQKVQWDPSSLVAKGNKTDSAGEGGKGCLEYDCAMEKRKTALLLFFCLSTFSSAPLRSRRRWQYSGTEGGCQVRHRDIIIQCGLTMGTEIPFSSSPLLPRNDPDPLSLAYAHIPRRRERGERGKRER